MRPYYQDEAVTIYHGDCREVLPTLAAEPFDACLTSPPYNARKGYPCDDWPTWADYYAFLRDVYALVPARVQGWLFPFSINDPQTGIIRATWSEACLPWKRVRLVLRHPDLDDSKSLISFPPRAEILVVDQWVEENGAKIWYVPHAKFAHTGRGFDAAHLDHPAPFHERLVVRFLEMFPSTRTIVDPFLGTGTTTWVAKKLGRKAVGVEIEERYCEVAARRLAQGVLL